MIRVAVFVVVLSVLGVSIGAIYNPALYRSARAMVGLPKAYEMNAAWVFSVSHQKRLDQSVRPEDVLVIGDSHVHGMNVAMLSPRAVNMGIGGDTSLGVLRRLAEYKSAQTAQAVVIAVGLNDLLYRNPESVIRNITTAIQMVKVPVILSAVLPVDETQILPEHPFRNTLIREINAGLEAACTDNCTFVRTPAHLRDDAENLRFHEGDGIHLSSKGYELWVQSLKAALGQVSINEHAPAVTMFWDACLPSLSAPPADGFYRVRSIGGTPETTEVITRLILEGQKTGTFTSPWMYDGDREITPVVGGYSVLTDSTDTPQAVLRTSGLMTIPFNQITEKETALDGPAIRALDVWRPIHVTFFTNALKPIGKSFAEDMPVTVEKFEVVCTGA